MSCRIRCPRCGPTRSREIDLREIERTWKDGALKQLTVLAVAHGADTARLTTAVAVGAAAHEIVRYAEAHGADTIVLGSHGHGLVRRFLLGSVADRVVRQSQCAVLIVPHQALSQPAGQDGAR